MSEPSTDPPVEIAHILFIDVVGYSKLLMNEQSEVLQQLNDVVRRTEQFRSAEASGKLIRIPVGDGMALVFFDGPEAPVRAAVEISESLRDRPQIRLRMGIHSGPVNKVLDVNERSNVAGAGINMAQRVMDCGDAGHILLSKRVADDLAPFGHWRSQLHELGEVEAKHGETVFLINFYNDKVGNRQLPQKLKKTRQEAIGSASEKRGPALGKAKGIPLVPMLIGGLVLVLGGVFFFSRLGPKQSSKSALPTDGIVASIPEKSIAVLPFDNLSKDEENAFFAGGVQDEILTNLAKIADLKVISRTSVMNYKSGSERNLRDIAKALGVAHVVEGTVQRAGGRIRVSAQLIDARSDAHLWADRYDRDIADVFAIQSEISQAIVSQLKAVLSPTEKTSIEQRPTKDTEAYDLYLRAKELVRDADPMSDPKYEEKMTAAIEMLEKAVSRDRNFASAYSLLTEANLDLYWILEQSPVYRTRAEVSLQTALRLAPDAGETHLARARFLYYGNREYDHAMEELERAARSMPNSADVFHLSALIERRLGRWSEATRHLLRASELNPRDSKVRSATCQTYFLTRNYSEALRLADRAMADFPEEADNFRLKKASTLVNQGDLKAARAELKAILPAYSHTIQAFIVWFFTALYERDYAEARRAVAGRMQLSHRDTLAPDSFFEGLIARAEGNKEKAQSAFLDAQSRYETLLRNHPDEANYFADAAIADAGLGRTKDAQHKIERAIELASDPLERPNTLGAVAMAYCWIGDRDHALGQLEDLAKIPNYTVTYGDLRFNPGWDSLRGDPRFEKIVASLKPK